MATSGARTRLSPDQRRQQLLDLGVRLFARRPLSEISVDLLAEAAGISRGLLYHYFGNITGFQEAVVRRAADQLIEQTAPPAEGDPIDRLLQSVAAYVDFVDDNYEGYLSLVKGAASGNAVLRAIYEESRSALTDRIFEQDSTLELPDTHASRMLVRGWAALAEQMVLEWKAQEPSGAGTAGVRVSREELLHLITAALPALVTALPAEG